ncbi:iron ABC transporter permease [Yaniella flava]|uniref:Iron ABC transporter permease n=1 Tax=Yaniella flava TaxID=287930 RepID=A0ABP5FVV3_9MICC
MFKSRDTSVSVPKTRGRLRFRITLSIALLALAVSCVLATGLGAVPIGLDEMWGTLTVPSADWTMNQVIFAEVRVPRVLTGIAVGAGLALSGLVLQITLRNDLAEPYLLGISSGASVGAVAVLIFGLALALPVAAFITGLLALFITLLISGFSGRVTVYRVILAGVAVSALFSAVTSLMIFSAPQTDSYRQVLHWIIGSLSSASWESSAISGATLLVFGGVLIGLTRLLEIFQLDDAEITGLGINTPLARGILMSLAALLAAGMVSVSGAIGFVGLMVPHVARTFARSSVSHQAILSVVFGAILLVLADTVARLVILPEELPVGIATSILGAIALCIIMGRKTRRKGV